MNYKIGISIILLFILLFSSISAISADDDDKYYTIDQAFIDLTVKNNALLHIDEIYDYTFHGKYNGVYRDIPLKDGESIDNIEVAAEGAYPVLEEINEDGQKRLKIYLYADESHTKKIRDCDVRVYISYDMKNVVTLFNDVGALQFKLWGDEWDVGVGEIKATIHLPGDKNNTYYLNPSEFNKTSKLKGNTIKATTYSIPSGDFYEALVMMPLSDFDSDAQYAKHVNRDGKELIEKNLQDSVNSRTLWNNIYILMGLLSFISPVGAILIYLKYGREPKVNYNGIYERELPSNDSPAVVNALYGNKNIGNPDMKGFEATILDLINRKLIKLDARSSENDIKELHLIFGDVDYSELENHEKIAFKILNNFAVNNDLNLSQLNSRLTNETNARWFIEQLDNWKESLKNQYLSENKLSQIFNSKGNYLIKLLGVGSLLVGIIFLVLGIFATLKSGIYPTVAGILLIILSIIYFWVPDDIFGQWTNEGRLMYLKWKNFKKFLKDNSLIKQHPPESIVIWNKYLIYGTALGVAEEVYKSMKLHVPNINEYDDLYWYHYYGGYGMMHHAFYTGQSTVASADSDSGSFGSVGGGSGGGGGGAF